MTPNQPYLLRAFYDWIVDNDLTPYVVVDANVPGTQVPTEHVRDGQIVLNISPSACAKLQMSNVDVNFEARFGGVARVINIPCNAVLAIYAKENGAGTVFSVDEALETQDSLDSQSVEKPKQDKAAKGKPNLKVVK